MVQENRILHEGILPSQKITRAHGERESPNTEGCSVYGLWDQRHPTRAFGGYDTVLDQRPRCEEVLMARNRMSYWADRAGPVCGLKLSAPVIKSPKIQCQLTQSYNREALAVTGPPEIMSVSCFVLCGGINVEAKKSLCGT